jgi:hypothetical protein
MGILQLPEQSLNPKPISKREFDDNEDASVVTYSEWLVRRLALLTCMIAVTYFILPHN